MSKNTQLNAAIATIIFGLLAIAGGIIILNTDSDESQNSVTDNTQNQTANATQQPSSTTPQQIELTTPAPAAQQAPAEPATTTAEPPAEADTSEVSRFITLSEYNANQATYDDQNKVLFFHASWCSICKNIENDINSDPSQIPADTTFILTDYDSQTALRQTHGVTTQYTFVQIDNSGNKIDKWSATNLDNAIAGVQS